MISVGLIRSYAVVVSVNQIKYKKESVENAKDGKRTFSKRGTRISHPSEINESLCLVTHGLSWYTPCRVGSVMIQIDVSY